jgi:hypothetical protein
LGHFFVFLPQRITIKTLFAGHFLAIMSAPNFVFKFREIMHEIGLTQLLADED